MNDLFHFDGNTVALGAVAILLALVVVYFFVRNRRRGSAGPTRGEPDRFNVLATKAGGRVTAERLVSGALKNGARSRAEAIERSIDELDRDRRSWR